MTSREEDYVKVGGGWRDSNCIDHESEGAKHSYMFILITLVFIMDFMNNKYSIAYVSKKY